MKKILPLSVTAGVLALIIGFMPLAQAQVQSDTVQGTVIVTAGTCGLQASGDSIDFGSLNFGAFSDVIPLGVSNTGSDPTNIYLSGNPWLSAAFPGDVMQVGATRYMGAPDAGPTTSLTSTATNTGIAVAPGISQSIDFQLKADTAAGFTGSATQAIFIGTLC
jgi:hypothetical protein